VPARVADLVAEPRHAGALDGAAVGEAGEDRMLVRIGLWLDGGAVRRARYRATSCAALIAYAEAACAALEGGADPTCLDRDALRRAVAGVHPVHHDRAALVARAIATAHRRAKEHSA
jgi:NifU-like protein involved in Fe-S cluster formation